MENLNLLPFLKSHSSNQNSIPNFSFFDREIFERKARRRGKKNPSSLSKIRIKKKNKQIKNFIESKEKKREQTHRANRSLPEETIFALNKEGEGREERMEETRS